MICVTNGRKEFSGEQTYRVAGYVKGMHSGMQSFRGHMYIVLKEGTRSILLVIYGLFVVLIAHWVRFYIVKLCQKG